MTALVSVLSITMIPIDCKLHNFPYTCGNKNSPNCVFHLSIAVSVNSYTVKHAL